MTQPDLRELAVAATPGPWQAEPMTGRGAWIRSAETKEWVALSCGNSDEEAAANAHFIAASSPAAIISLLDSHAAETASLREERDRLRAALEPFANYMAEGGDLDNTGKPLPDDQAVGWIYLTHADFRRAREALAQHEVKE